MARIAALAGLGSGELITLHAVAGVSSSAASGSIPVPGGGPFSHDATAAVAVVAEDTVQRTTPNVAT